MFQRVEKWVEHGSDEQTAQDLTGYEPCHHVTPHIRLGLRAHKRREYRINTNVEFLREKLINE
ncbi:unnamed protein product, partial [marine sediment metagenome]